MTKKAVIAALVFIALYNIFLYDTVFGVSIGIFFLLLNVYNFFTRSTTTQNEVVGHLFAITSTVAAFLFAVRTNELVQVINIITAVIGAAAAYYFYKLHDDSHYTLVEIVNAPFNALAGLFQGTKEIVFITKNAQTEKESTSKVPAILRGLSITIPIVGLLLVVLYSADPVFAKITRDFIDTLFGRVAISAFLFAILVILYKSSIHRIWGNKNTVTVLGKKYEPLILNGSVAVILLAFVLIQIRYVFMYVSQEELQKIGIASLTYSEYVRQGFFQLLLAALISSSAIIYAIRSLHSLEPKYKKILQMLAGLVTIETIILLFAAGKRVFEYNASHGLTRARIFGIVFLIWLCVALIYLAINIVKHYNARQAFLKITALLILAVLSVNLINIDSLVATRFKPTVNKETDYYYISGLSTDAFESWEEAISNAEQTVRTIAAKPTAEITVDDNRKLTWASMTLSNLDFKKDYVIQKYGTEEEIKQQTFSTYIDLEKDKRLEKLRKWQSYNLSEWQAYQWLKDNREIVQKLKPLQNEITGIQDKLNDNIRYNTPLDRAIEPPLL